jgi:hypothetical protein
VEEVEAEVAVEEVAVGVAVAAVVVVAEVGSYFYL